jgi:hypothetical protein
MRRTVNPLWESNRFRKIVSLYKPRRYKYIGRPFSGWLWRHNWIEPLREGQRKKKTINVFR